MFEKMHDLLAPDGVLMVYSFGGALRTGLEVFAHAYFLSGNPSVHAFTGEVFRGAIGRSDFPNSSGGDMEASLRRFLALPDHLIAYPGHGPDTTVGRERATNPFLRQLD